MLLQAEAWHPTQHAVPHTLPVRTVPPNRTEKKKSRVAWLHRVFLRLRPMGFADTSRGNHDRFDLQSQREPSSQPLASSPCRGPTIRRPVRLLRGWPGARSAILWYRLAGQVESSGSVQRVWEESGVYRPAEASRLLCPDWPFRSGMNTSRLRRPSC